MGMPMYGQSFSLADNKENGLNAPTYGGGEAGEETRARGFLAYYEVNLTSQQTTFQHFFCWFFFFRFARTSRTKTGRWSAIGRVAWDRTLTIATNGSRSTTST